MPSREDVSPKFGRRLPSLFLFRARPRPRDARLGMERGPADARLPGTPRLRLRPIPADRGSSLSLASPQRSTGRQAAGGTGREAWLQPPDGQVSSCRQKQNVTAMRWTPSLSYPRLILCALCALCGKNVPFRLPEGIASASSTRHAPKVMRLAYRSPWDGARSGGRAPTRNASPSVEADPRP